MSNSPERSSTGPRSSSPVLVTILLACGMFAGLWFGAQALAGRPLSSDTDAASAPTAEAWPTVMPTVTPLPAAAAAPMPTPIPLRFEQTRRFQVGELTLFSIQPAQPDKGWHAPGQTIPLKITYRVLIFVDLMSIPSEHIVREGNTISVTIPPPIWELPDDTIIRPANPQQNLSQFFEGGPPTQVIAKGSSEVARQIEESEALRQLMRDAAIHQITAHLESLGFRRVTVTIAQ